MNPVAHASWSGRIGRSRRSELSENRQFKTLIEPENLSKQPRPPLYSIAPTSNQIQSSTSNTITRTYVYDANGSITSNGVLSLAYDGAGRLSSAQGSPHYDNALGQRTLTKIGNSMPRWHVYDEAGRMLGTYFRFLSGYYETVYLDDLPIAVVDVVNGIKYVDTDGRT